MISIVDDCTLYPPQLLIVQKLLMLTKDNVSKSVYCKVLSCLCGQCREDQCLSLIVSAFSHDLIASLIDTYEGLPAIIRTLFLLYSFIMESQNRGYE